MKNVANMNVRLLENIITEEFMVNSSREGDLVALAKFKERMEKIKALKRGIGDFSASRKTL